VGTAMAMPVQARIEGSVAQQGHADEHR